MKYGLLGEKLSHSFSPYIHGELKNKHYVLKEIKKEDLESFLKTKDFNAINVTIPYKEEVIKYLDNISADGIGIGAVNTIVNKNGKLYGYNTDLYGLIALIKKNNIDINNKKVIILGTGGTSKTAKYACSLLGAKVILKASRRVDNSNLSNAENIFTYDEIIKNHNDANIIINTTPVGMFSNVDLENINKTPIDINSFKNLEAIIDIIYNPLNTKILQDAKKKNIKTANGLYMLIAQAVYADKLFFDKNEDEKEIEEIIDKIYKKMINKFLNIILIGMPGSGKSVVGKELSNIINKEFVDLDELFFKKYNKKAGDYIREFGEEDFRNKETDIIDEISRNTNLIISTGGGVVLKEKNIEMLKRNGILFFIDRNIDNIKPTKSRPLTEDRDKLKKVYDIRLPLYEKYADFIIKTDEIIEHTVEKIINIFNNV